jgi:hypothetical protein
LRAEKFRRRAEICMRFSGQVSNPDLAQRLRLMASEYLVKAEEEESQMVSGAQGAGEVLPIANPELSTK